MAGRVFVLGSFAVDSVFRCARMPARGETLLGSGFALGPGGKGSNQAVAAARAGAKVSLMTAVGRDAFADLARSTWDREGIDHSHTKVVDGFTGAAAILVNDRTGENAIVVVPGACGTLSAADVQAASEAIRSAAVLVVQLEIPIAAVLRGLQIAREAGVTTILNPAPAPTEPLSAELLALVDYLIPNETEAAQLVEGEHQGDMTTEQLIAGLQELGCGQVLMTLGERGSVLCRNTATENIEAVVAGPVVDTTGAGDAFCGAFATALSEGRTATEAARFASAASGISVSRHGTAMSMPQRDEIDTLYPGPASAK